VIEGAVEESSRLQEQKMRSFATNAGGSCTC